jgi:hypothetical protein
MDKEIAHKIKGRILIASTPRLAPRVPAPISEATSISLIFSYAVNKKWPAGLKNEWAIGGGDRQLISIEIGGQRLLGKG